LRIAVSADTTISAINSFESSEMSKLITSVGPLWPRNLRLSFLINTSVTKQTVISPLFFTPSLRMALRTAFFIFPGEMEIFFCRFVMIMFGVLFITIGDAAVVYPAEYPDEYRRNSFYILKF